MVKAKALKQLRKRTDKANKVDDLLQCINEDETILSVTITANASDHDEEEQSDAQRKFTVEAVAASQLSGDLKQKVVDLFQANMGEYYRNSSWGLDMEKKREELEHRNARYLLLRDNSQDGDLVAFSHFRFEMNDEESPEYVVLYVYELQVQAKYRKLGIGKRLMHLLEKIAQGNGMDSVMLTVFKANENAMDFYTQGLRYSVDDDSPPHADYEILCKRFNTNAD
jgi:ribosomal protein S18 acetylase RimI-like enzyme